MSTPFEPNGQSEETEAKLCAYLEGELGPEERADIELYLKNNPQHRQLLRELAATRFDVQKLPKEKAPAEIAEAFHGHIERSMLLDGVNDVDPVVRMHRWPQMMLLAAMVLLAAGLGIIVYIILPGPVQKYSVAPPVTVVTAPPAGAVAAPSAQQSEKTPMIVPNEPMENPMAAVPVIPPTLSQPLLNANDHKTELNDQDKLQKTGSAMATAAVDRSRTLTDDLINKAAAVAPQRKLDLSASDQLAKAGLSEGLAGRACVVIHTDDPRAAGKQLRDYFASNSIPYQAMNDGMVMNGATGNGANAPIDLKWATAAATQPMASASKDTTAPTTREALALTRNTDADGAVYVAKAMTQQETAKLKGALVSAQNGQTAELFPAEEQQQGERRLNDVPVISTSQPAMAAATMPTTEPAALGVNEIGVGDQLVVTVAQLAGPGMDKTNTVKVAENGTVIVPMIDPVMAAGLSPADLEKAIAEKYREGNLIPDAKVTVSRLPTTQPSELSKPATTQPERADVVVVIEKNNAATQPTTAPMQP